MLWRRKEEWTVTNTFDVSFCSSLNQQLGKQASWPSFKTPRSCCVTIRNLRNYWFLINSRMPWPSNCWPIHSIWSSCGCSRGCFKNIHKLLNLRALKFSSLNKIHMFQCMGRYFMCNFKGILWNSTQNILVMHWKMEFLVIVEFLSALKFKSS